MSAAENRALMERIFAGLEVGDGALFVESLADDFIWHLKGKTAWSRTYQGKDVVRRELLRPLFAQFADQYTNTLVRLVAEGDIVVAECQGRVMAKSGERYDNAYCWIVRIAGGKLVELTEYMDTELVSKALRPPATA
jgi:ketosteroid isomerase-like protein